jgi:1-deoxy-D-xylulose-5-phosphate synthase
MGGFGGAVLEVLARNGVKDRAVRIIAIPDRYIEHAKPQLQREQCGLEASQVAEAVRELLRAQPPVALGEVS